MSDRLSVLEVHTDSENFFSHLLFDFVDDTQLRSYVPITQATSYGRISTLIQERLGNANALPAR